MSADMRIESYLKTVSAQLGAATIPEREKISEEIAAHVHDSVEKKGESMETVLTRLGPPERLGERYRESLTIYQASRSYSPIVLLMSSFRRGILGILAALLGLAGYWLGGILLVFGVLTLFWAAIHAQPHGPVPIGTSFKNIFELIGVGLLSLLLSTLLLRAILRFLGRRHAVI